jgi:hypothetical protein
MSSYFAPLDFGGFDMKLGKWVLGLAAMALFFAGTADAQIADNRLCIQNGSEYYVNGPFYGFPNHGAGRYFPSFAHWPGTTNNGVTFDWKINGWAFAGMQGPTGFGNFWYWETALQAAPDNPKSSAMSFDYPQLFALGLVPNTGAPMPIYGGATPTTIGTAVGGQNWLMPSSAGGWDGYLNVFATGVASFFVPSTSPFYGWQFAFTLLNPCPSAITVPSNTSIWEFVWSNNYNAPPPSNQYALLSGNEIDCLGGRGNRGRNYSLISDSDNGYLWYWGNTGAGVSEEWDMCIFVCDSVTIPYNVPGAPNASNPFYAYGFDVGTPTLMPFQTTGCVLLGFTFEDYANPGGIGVALASISVVPLPYTKGGNLYRITNIDTVTNVFLGISSINTAVMIPGYPACMFGSTVGGFTPALPFPPDPLLIGAEFYYYSLQGNAPGKLKPSAAYMVTYF